MFTALALLLLSKGLAATGEWQRLGTNAVGEYQVDRASLRWIEDNAAFSINTRVLEKDASEWLMTVRIGCSDNMFAYTNGSKIQQGSTVASFDKPRPAEAIDAGSMPQLLQKEYCTTPGARAAGWEPLGKSSIASVYFDRASVRQNGDLTRFTANTRVVPFDHGEETVSSIAFHCEESTFTVLKLSKGKSGQWETLIDKPQAPAAINKTATLKNLAAKFCVEPGLTISDWQSIASTAGIYKRVSISPSSIRWSKDKRAFVVMMKAESEPQTEMLNNVSVDCDKNSYTYLSGRLTTGKLVENMGSTPARTIKDGTVFSTLKNSLCSPS